MTQTLLLPRWLLYDADQPPERDWGLVVEGPRVLDVGPRPRLMEDYPQAERLALDDYILIPGLVNAHTHMYGVLAHGIPLDQAPEDFWAFLEDFWWPRVEDALTHELIAAATDNFCLEMVQSGVTTFYDILEAPYSLPGALPVEGEVVERWGLRGILSFEATQRVSEENGELGLRENADFIKAHRDPDDLVGGLMCYHTTFSCSADFIRRAVEMAKELGTPVHFHCNEGVYEPEYCLEHFGKRTIEYYDELGVLGPHTLASQCVQVSAREIELLGQHGASATHMPLSNCEVGGGFAPVPELLEAGVTMGLGTDGYVNNFFEVMRGAFFYSKARLLSPQVMPAHTAWHMATKGGGASLGLENVGALQPGYSADLVCLDADLPTPLSPGNLLEQVLLQRNPEHVRHVMVAGRWLMRDGEILNADPEAIRARCREAAQTLWDQ